jgi:site-specific recombinase XerD
MKIKRRSLQSFITKLAKDVLHRPLSFHTLRHGFGSHLAGLGVPLHQVQMLMGHSRLDTTGIYLHANPKDAIDKAQELF